MQDNRVLDEPSKFDDVTSADELVKEYNDDQGYNFLCAVCMALILKKVLPTLEFTDKALEWAKSTDARSTKKVKFSRSRKNLLQWADKLNPKLNPIEILQGAQTRCTRARRNLTVSRRPQRTTSAV